MRVADHIPANPERELWDAIVIGTGMGGSTTGFELARLGRRVLFLEKGKFLHEGLGSPRLLPKRTGLEEERLLVGRWPHPIKGITSFGPVEFHGPLGCGSGGSTTLYSAQLERFTPADFRPRENFPDVAGANLPEAWPLSYDELAPFYRRAEALFGVCGTTDPLYPDPDAQLRAPLPLSARDEALFASLTAAGLHPYRSHVGFHRTPNCYECFDLCPKYCKADAANACLVPALTEFGASILPECDVLELIPTRRDVKAVRARRDDREIQLSARTIVLASGAFATPVLLLNSRSREWPDGLANQSGEVGRNLMLHASDILAVDHQDKLAATTPMKSISLNDFYLQGDRKLGTLQSVGLPLVPPIILSYLRYMEEKDPRAFRLAVSDRLPALAQRAATRYARTSLMTTIVEDLPYPDNRVIADPAAPGGRRFVYSYSPDLAQRSRELRLEFARRLAPRHKVTSITGGQNNINYGHVCGTCRFGDDPATSVLDPTNRAHGLDNLYVVDASFFPSSGGTNPSLTIAANALRVGGIIHQSLA